MTQDRLADENGRLAALRRYDALDGGMDEGFGHITRLVQMALGLPMVTLSLIERDRPIYKSVRGISDDDALRTAPIGAAVIAGSLPLVIGDLAQDGRFAEITDVRAYLGVPLTSPDGYNIGVIAVMDTAPRVFDPRQIGMLQEFASLVIEQMEQRQGRERDGLTGTLSRRGFYIEVEKEFARASRYDRPTSLVFFDIDHFKVINEAFGHEAGDEALRALSTQCLAMLRQTDAFGRIAGQEFALLLPETNAEEALQCAERLRQMIETLRFRTLPGLMSVTASFGVAPLSQSFINAAQWFAETDVALFEAKRQGRNRCVLATRPRLRAVQPEGNGTIEAAAATIIH